MKFQFIITLKVLVITVYFDTRKGNPRFNYSAGYGKKPKQGILNFRHQSGIKGFPPEQDQKNDNLAPIRTYHFPVPAVHGSLGSILYANIAKSMLRPTITIFISEQTTLAENHNNFL